MSDVRNFLLFCLPRTGSTTLLKIINLWPGVECVNEPFSPDCDPRIKRRASNIPELRAAIKHIWSQRAGFKHVANWDGWPFGNQDLTHELLRMVDRCNIVFLTRVNLLRRNVSYELARQSKVWHFWTEKDKTRSRTTVYHALDCSTLRSQMNRDIKFMRDCRQTLDSVGIRYLEVPYESLFVPDIGYKRQLAAVQQVTSFLGLAREGSVLRSGKIYELLRANPTVTASHQYYRRIPNVEEIERSLGSNDTGWLFD